LLTIGGSHKSGFLDPSAIEAWKSSHEQITGAAQAGDVILMRPTILHSSSVAVNPDRRRVLHIEYANMDLPFGLRWAEA
jgi:hypothetical protein